MTGRDDLRFDRHDWTVSADVESLFKDNFFLGCRTALPYICLYVRITVLSQRRTSLTAAVSKLQPWGSRDLIEIYGYIQNWQISLASGSAKTFLTVRVCRFMQL